MGHPLHALLTDVPIGAWSVTAILDGLAAFGAAELDPGADAALTIGLLPGFAAAAAGLADWSDTTDDPRTLGALHALLNSGAMAAYGAALYAARTRSRPARRVLAFAGYGLCALAAFLGGELSFGLQLGAKHTAEPLTPPQDFVPTVSFDEVSESAPLRVVVEGIPVLLSRRGQEPFAVSAVCTHRGGPLDASGASGGCVQCPWHGSRFSLADGRVAAGPATFPLPRFETRLRAGIVEIRAFSLD